jgi:twitching motility two-component system response regulator PilG
MKSHLSEGFDEKIRCFESILALEPDNVAAKAGRDSLLTIFGTVEAANTEQAASYFNSEVSTPVRTKHSPEAPTHKSPTEDREGPADFSNAPTEAFEAKFENTPEAEYEHEEPEIVAEPFATYAEEAAVPDATTTIDAEQSSVEAELNDVHFGPTVEEVPAAESVYADPQTETVAFNYDVEPDHLPSDNHEPDYNSSPAIAMPAEALPLEERFPEPAAELLVQATDVLTVRAESIECPFCGQTNDPQVISCISCMAVLTLSDLELLLGNHTPDKLRLREAVEEMERQRRGRALDSNELVTLGLGHLNLRNLQMGYSCLLEASQLNPNNVVLSAQVNSLLIRLEEIKKQEEAQLRMPKGKSILVVDDSPTVRKLIAGKLEKCGHEVICANDGVEAMERLEHFVPDLILLDITMPRMDGYQVCKQIRSNSSTKDVTVVMISGKDGFFDKVRGRMAGTTGYITKPFGPETLMKAVEMYLSGEAPELDEA